MPHGRKKAGDTRKLPGADSATSIVVLTAPKRKRQTPSDLLRRIRRSDEQWEKIQDMCAVVHQVRLHVLLVQYAR